jgi:hypothetical protein
VIEEISGKRVSESRAKVDECFGKLGKIAESLPVVRVQTDKKSSYATILRERFGEKLAHHTTSSKAPRKYGSTLFPINHTLAMQRDGLSRFVRRNWGTTKKRFALEHHLWIWIAWRNYVRSITNKNRRQSAAMVAGLIDRMLDLTDLLRWRVFPAPCTAKGSKVPAGTGAGGMA